MKVRRLLSMGCHGKQCRLSTSDPYTWTVRVCAKERVSGIDFAGTLHGHTQD